MKEGERVLSFAGTTMLSSSSSLRGLAISLFLLFFFFFSADEIMCVPDSNYTNNRRVETLKLARIERRLDKINKPAVRTIEVISGGVLLIP